MRRFELVGLHTLILITFAITSVGTQETARIRTPYPHDVLSVRGTGPTYHHPWNVQFREWVSERKRSYLLAPNSEKKKRIVREVIALVQNQNPSGHFLT
jgi:hypothetical protein